MLNGIANVVANDMMISLYVFCPHRSNDNELNKQALFHWAVTKTLGGFDILYPIPNFLTG